MKNNVFKFVTVRPPRKPDNKQMQKNFIMPNVDTPFYSGILELVPEGMLAQAKELASKYMESASYLPDPSTPVEAILKALDVAPTVAEAMEAVAGELGEDVSHYLESPEVVEMKIGLWDSLYAQTLMPKISPDDRETIYDGIRALNILEKLVTEVDGTKPVNWDTLWSASPVVPSDLIPAAEPVSQDLEKEESIEKALELLGKLNEKVQSLNLAITDIRNVDRVYKVNELRQFAIGEEAEAPDPDMGSIRILNRVSITAPFRMATPIRRIEPVAIEDGEVAQILESETIVVPPREPWLFTELATEKLRPTTIELLKMYKEDLIETEPITTIAVLEKKITESVRSFFMSISPEIAPFVVETDIFQQVAQQVPLSLSGMGVVTSVALPKPEPGSPTARGIRPLGIGDLQVVQDELLRYEVGEVAHIENVLKSEHKTRTHKRLTETEETFVIETEEIKETEKDLQSTERFELQKEAQKTIESEMSIDAGVSVTGSYGPVSVTAHADFAYSQSSSESNKSASKYAKEITERSIEKLVQRAREERTLRTLERVEEINEHGFDNSKGSGHITGIYRWVDKYYKARIINYGRRLMIEFIIPEPAAFFRYLEHNQEPPNITMSKPKEPEVWGRPLESNDLNRYNYEQYVADYNIQDVEPYPAETVTVSAAFAEAPSPEGGNKAFAKTSEKLVVPKGYIAVDTYGTYGGQGIKGTDYFWSVRIGGESWPVTNYGLEGIIPISVNGWGTAFNVNVVTVCWLKDETKKAWQLKTYQSIMNAYHNLLAEYNEQIAAAEIQAGVQIVGRNPEINRKIERDELRKGTLRLLTDEYAQTRVSSTWRFDEVFDAMKSSGNYGYPEFNVDEAMIEGKIIQFFEQSFDWNNMTYRFYPYFWGRKANWKEIFPKNDPDPKFTDFLRAGAARVIVPVHLAYNVAVLHYLWTSEIWNGGEVPTINDPLYISIVDEIKSDTGAALDGDLPMCSEESAFPCIVDEWEYKLPTSLVYLQQDARLPDFTKPIEQQGEIVIIPEGVPVPRMLVGERGRVNPNNEIPLNIRSNPGLGASVIDTWAGGVEFDVLDGPRYADGFLWWLLNNGTEQGWGAEGVIDYYYLETIP